ncbi:cell division protein FtsQ/DivIB [Candidatus Nesciobacter abundans]|uniref:FtsQ-type POTRA domain-containing protein n=1 Tax=Candidatus Nesciobacter abundans TaxID=2601668 RepID=A0A5C0UGT0_9PROT|nr:FtsQ-type POTRA domain-containing protein [Candidatus Nesciobacter abundans]QEK39288.1 FtsQ-type POTRA domain-containing protein [Candidatus Nesciobacter abundans]
MKQLGMLKKKLHNIFFSVFCAVSVIFYTIELRKYDIKNLKVSGNMISKESYIKSLIFRGCKHSKVMLKDQNKCIELNDKNLEFSEKGIITKNTAYSEKENFLSLGKLKLLDLSAKKTRKCIEKNKWIEKCTIEKIWPDTLKVSIQEYVPYAHSESAYFTLQGNKIDKDSKDTSLNINKDSNAFDNLGKLSKNHELCENHLIKMLGNFTQEDMLSLFRILEKYHDFRKIVKSANMIRPKRWNIVTNENKVIKLRTNEIERSIKRYMEFPMKNEYKIIDLRHPQRVIISNSNPTTKAITIIDAPALMRN